MPRKNVNGFVGDAVYGGAGEYIYEHSDGSEVYVYPEPNAVGWGVAAVISHAPGYGPHKNLAESVSKDAAFQRAYKWMENYDTHKARNHQYSEFGGFG